MSEHIQDAKRVARDYIAAVDGADTAKLIGVLSDHVSADYYWRGMHPFYELDRAEAVASVFWEPLRRSLTSLQRREDIFFAGDNQHDESVWTCSMGNFLGLFDRDWLGIPATRKMVFLPYAEFHRVEGGKIAETALFIDIIRVMQQAGRDPIPHQTAAAFVHPGPRTHDGVLLDEHDAAEGDATRDLLDRMVADLVDFNTHGGRPPPSMLQRTWHDDMVWYGPAGIGATYTIPRYQEQHQYPFRDVLVDKVFNGHVARMAEGNYSGWFGWPNLNNRNGGGFLGLPESVVNAEMRVVDVYRRDGDKLAENWVFIDMLYYLAQHGYEPLEDWQVLHRVVAETKRN